ncbi:hypothetical protein PM082_006233 [Marasmius tenuissimus]|nr:hypothetical protein PM082_006233 [Marasmius tenuissimus]
MWLKKRLVVKLQGEPRAPDEVISFRPAVAVYTASDTEVSPLEQHRDDYSSEADVIFIPTNFVVVFS